MGAWLRRNTWKKKYVINHEHDRMDQILEGLFLSTQPDKLKEILISRVCEQGSRPSHPEATVRGVLQVSSKWILHGTTSLQVSSGFKLLNTWGSHNLAIFQTFFTPALVANMLTHGYGIPAHVPLLLREGFRVMSRIGARNFYEHAQIVQNNITKFVCSTQERLVVHNVGLLLEEFNECIPAEESEVVNFCLAVLNHLSVGVPSQGGGGEEIQTFIRYTDDIAKSLGMVWKLQPPALLSHCLAEIFNIISEPRTDDQLESAICLAAVVKHIPIEVANRVVKTVVTEDSVSDKSVGVAVAHIVEWLKWPTAHNVDLWLQCFLTELAAARKYTLLIHITETYAEQVTENMAYAQLRQASFKILFHMLLGFQHSPGPFHKCLEKMSTIFQRLRNEKLPQTETFLLRMSQLIYCLMYQHSGFPDLYEPVLELIKDYPQPSADEIKAVLEQTKWSSQATCTVVMEAVGPSLPVTSVKQEKLEPGKTGLENLGNTCYMNSVIQALYMCDQFRRGVLDKFPQGKENLLVKLQHVFAHLSQSHRPTMTPRKFLQASRPPWFLPGHQQDCSEFLKYLLNHLHEDEKYSCQSSTEKRPSCESVSTGTIRLNMDTLSKAEKKKKASVTLTAVKRKTEEEMNCLNSSGSGSCGSGSESMKSLVQRTFRGKVQTTLRCLACRQESLRVESFVDIPLAFPNSSRSTDFPHKNLAGGDGGANPEPEVESIQVAEAELANPSEVSFSLNDLISFYLKPERLTGDNKYHCDRCGKLQDGERSIQIIESPQYLILTLLRFSYDTKLQSRTKIFQDVRYPRTLSVPVCGEPTSFRDTKLRPSKQYSGSSNYASSKSDGVTAESHCTKLEDIAKCLAPKCDSSNQSSSKCFHLYGLSGVIVHSGTSSECGHYYCYARHSQAGQIDAGLLDKIGDNLQDIDLLPDKWYNFNDSRVSHTTFNSFSNVTKRFSKDTAYVLIYRKLNLEGPSFGLDTDLALRPDLRDAVIKDNEAYLKEQEMEAKMKAEQRRRRSSSANSVNLHSWRGKDRDDDDDDNPHGGQNGLYGDGFGNGLDISGSRFVY